ncbi:uncharacterized protein [Haliotis cracherodii]|uniref:uncharacterized protein n=1 Tax=Haliotis cracherodii TaxID=6455 RepID=UPI0039ED5623
MDAVNAKQMSARKAAVAFGIPKSTLHDKLSNKVPLVYRKGPSPILSKDEERHLSDWAIHMSSIGYGRTRDELLDTVQKIIKLDGRENPFTDDRPGRDWFRAFLKRNPTISVRTPTQLSKERAMVSQQKIADWFDTFTTYIADKTDSDILHDPSRLYNADESGFPMCPKSGRVLAERGSQTVYNFSASDKSQITVLACASASGDYTPPMIVFPGSRFKYNPLDGFKEAVLGRTENGWMDAELFVSWLKTCFIPHVDKQAIKKPIILFLDGHSTHLTLEACTVCVENNIVLYCLPSHASHVIQPLDLSLFSPLKHAWRQSVRDFQISSANVLGNYKPTVLPKSASGEDIRELLLEKKRKAEEEKQMKESRKRMREEIKLKREEEKAARKALREKEREEKRVQKRKQEDEKKAYKLLKQIEKKSKATLDSDEDLSESEIPYMDDDEYDDDDDIDFSDDSLRDFCHLCLGRDLAANDDWVGCLNCTKWFHKNCLGYQTLTHQQLADLPFTCDTCS